MNTTDYMPPPVFDLKKETLNEFLRRVQKYESYINKEKYNIILKIINEIFNLSDKYAYTSLTSIKHIKLSKLNIDKKITSKQSFFFSFPASKYHVMGRLNLTFNPLF